MIGWLQRLLDRPEPASPHPVSGQPMEECPWPGTLSPDYVDRLREQGEDVSEMEPWVER